MEQLRKLIFFRTYFRDFVDSLPKKVQEKIGAILFTVTVAPRIPIKFFQYIVGTDGLYEIRVEF